MTNLLVGSWELNSDKESTLYQIYVPRQWRQIASSFAQQRAKLYGKKYASVPVYSLDSIVVASFSQIVQTARKAWQNNNLPWLFAKEKIDLCDLPELIKDWLREEFYSSLGAEVVESKLEKLNDDLWQWEDEPVIYPLRPNLENSSEINSILYRVIPDFLAEEFLQNPTVIFAGESEQELTFYRVVKLDRAELMSWPPSPVPIQKKETIDIEYISFVISFKLQTVPRRKYPLVYHKLSIRRWITEPLKNFPYRGTTVYIGDNRRWLDGEYQPFRFMPVKIKKYGQEAKYPKAIERLLSNNDSPLPATEILAQNPQYNWSEPNQQKSKIQAAIAYDFRHYIKPKCLPGVSPLDLFSLDRAICDRLPVNRVGEAVKIPGNFPSYYPKGAAKKKGDKTPKEPNELNPIMLRPKIVKPALFSQQKTSLHTILILWETKKCRDELINEIIQLLSLSQQEETKIEGEREIRIDRNELGSFCIQTQHVADLTQNFSIDKSAKNKQKLREKLLEERIKNISYFLPKTKQLSGALIEIRPKPIIRESDPKLAWRIAAAQQNYLNQHILALTKLNKEKKEYVTKDAINRVKRAVSDLLRQFGIFPLIPLIDDKKDKIEANTWLTCFCVIRRTKKTNAENIPLTVALMVRVNPVNCLVEATTPSLFQNKGWVSYPEMLQQLINLTKKWLPDSEEGENNSETNEDDDSKEKQRDRTLLNQFICDCLGDCLNTPIAEDKSPNVIFTAEAQNARKQLKWLQNPYLPLNDLPDSLKNNLSRSQIERLSVVRLRLEVKNEVPVAILEGKPGRRISGLFEWKGVCDEAKKYLYLSKRNPLTTEKFPLKENQSRLDSGSNSAVNPPNLEIAIVHSPNIENDRLAKLIHYLRDRWPYFPDYTSLPLPFPFAIAAKEYAVSIRDTKDLEFTEEL